MFKILSVLLSSLRVSFLSLFFFLPSSVPLSLLSSFFSSFSFRCVRFHSHLTALSLLDIYIYIHIYIYIYDHFNLTNNVIRIKSNSTCEIYTVVPST